MATCKSCGDSIEFVKTSNGRKMPVNHNKLMVEVETNQKPDTCVVTDDGRVVWGVAALQDHEMKAGVFVEGYISHFATCPAAEEHRK